MLASDFLVLGRRQMPAPAPPAPPVLTSRATDLSQAVPAVASTPRMPQTPPMVIRQEMPLWPHVLGTPYATFRGTIDVTIRNATPSTPSSFATPLDILITASLSLVTIAQGAHQVTTTIGARQNAAFWPSGCRTVTWQS